MNLCGLERIGWASGRMVRKGPTTMSLTTRQQDSQGVPASCRAPTQKAKAVYLENRFFFQECCLRYGERISDSKIYIGIDIKASNLKFQLHSTNYNCDTSTKRKKNHPREWEVDAGRSLSLSFSLSPASTALGNPPLTKDVCGGGSMF